MLIGSSFGIDAIQHFPILAHKAGVDIICGNLYSSGIKLNQIVAKNNANENFEIYGISDGTKWVRQSGEKTISRALADYEWDIIILQRSAHSSHTWTEIQRRSLYQIMDVIRRTTAYEPEILFNS